MNGFLNNPVAYFLSAEDTVSHSQSIVGKILTYDPLLTVNPIHPTMALPSQQQVEYALKDFSVAADGRCDMTLLYNRRRFCISFCASDLREPGGSRPSSHEVEFSGLVQALGEEDDQASPVDSPTSVPSTAHMGEASTEPTDSAIRPCLGSCSPEPLEDWVMQVFGPTMHKLAPSSSMPCPVTLHEAIHPPTLSFTFKLIDGQPAPVAVPNDPGVLQYFDETVADISDAMEKLHIPRVQARDIPIAKSLDPMSSHVVWFQGERCFFKQVQPNIPNQAYTREIQMLIRLRKAGLSETLRVPQLRGLVNSEQDRFILGILLSSIDAKYTLWNHHDAPLALRRKWYDQAAKTVHQMHAADVVWGDVTAANILIDEDQNAWLVDFGGGASPGWIDEAKSETKAGDLQGLSRLKAFLRIE